MANILSNPDGFFSEMMQRNVNLKRPFLIILILAIISSISQYFIVTKMAEAFPPEVAGFLMIGAYTGVITSLITLIIVWLVISLIMFGISSVLGGQGEFKRLFEFTGYGFLPSIISSFITTPVMVYYISKAVVPKLSMADIQSGDFGKDFMSALMPSDVVYFNLIISIAFFIWSFTIWTFGVKNARKLEMSKAVMTVLIPVIAYIGYTVYAMLSFL
jgi:hypothetical protein